MAAYLFSSHLTEQSVTLLADDGGSHARRRSLYARCRWRRYESSISAYRWQTRPALAPFAAHDLILPGNISSNLTFRLPSVMITLPSDVA